MSRTATTIAALVLLFVALEVTIRSRQAPATAPQQVDLVIADAADQAPPPSPTEATAAAPLHVRRSGRLELTRNITHSHFSHFVLESTTFCRSDAPLTVADVVDVTSLACPQKIEFLSDNNDTFYDRQSSFVVKKYSGYAKRCTRTRGMMWLLNSRAKHDLVADRVMESLTDGVAPQDRAGITQLLDWGSGCGPTLWHYSKRFGGESRFRAIGVERVPEAVEWARKYSAAAGVTFCNADGTKLEWLPEGSFDFIISYAGIPHLPSSNMCPTIRNLLRVLKPGGRMWFGYFDVEETMRKILACKIQCATVDASEVVVHVVDEASWWKDIKLHKAYTLSNPKSLIWEKRS